VFGFHEPAEPDRTKVYVPEALINRSEADALVGEIVRLGGRKEIEDMLLAR
jgi:hypothetical protein